MTPDPSVTSAHYFGNLLPMTWSHALSPQAPHLVASTDHLGAPSSIANGTGTSAW